MLNFLGEPLNFHDDENFLHLNNNQPFMISEEAFPQNLVIQGFNTDPILQQERLFGPEEINFFLNNIDNNHTYNDMSIRINEQRNIIDQRFPFNVQTEQMEIQEENFLSQRQHYQSEHFSDYSSSPQIQENNNFMIIQDEFQKQNHQESDENAGIIDIENMPTSETMPQTSSPDKNEQIRQNDFKIILLWVEIYNFARDITRNAKVSKKCIEKIFRLVKNYMTYKAYSGFRHSLRADLGNIDKLAEKFKESPSKYNYAISPEKLAERKNNSNPITDVTSSVSAEAIVEYLSDRELRLIFQHSLEMIKNTEYRCYKSTDENEGEQEEKKQTYKHKIIQLEELAKMIDKAQK